MISSHVLLVVMSPAATAEWIQMPFVTKLAWA